MPKKSRSRSRRQRGGGEGAEGMMKGAASGAPADTPSLTPKPADMAAAAMSGGRRSRRRRSRGGAGGPEGMSPGMPPSDMTGGRKKKAKKGGEGIIATAALPFGLLALQRYFKGSRSTKKNVRGLGNTFKRTFRRRR